MILVFKLHELQRFFIIKFQCGLNIIIVYKASNFSKLSVLTVRLMGVVNILISKHSVSRLRNFYSPEFSSLILNSSIRFIYFSILQEKCLRTYAILSWLRKHWFNVVKQTLIFSNFEMNIYMDQDNTIENISNKMLTCQNLRPIVWKEGFFIVIEIRNFV